MLAISSGSVLAISPVQELSISFGGLADCLSVVAGQKQADGINRSTTTNVTVTFWNLRIILLGRF